MGKPYAIAAIITMLIGSAYILFTSDIFHYNEPVQVSSEVEVDENINTEAIAENKTQKVKEQVTEVQTAAASISVIGYVNDGPASIDLQYENLTPGTEYGVAVCMAQGKACTEWVESFTPESVSGEYKMTTKKAFGPDSTKGLGSGSKRIMLFQGGFGQNAVYSNVFDQ